MALQMITKSPCSFRVIDIVIAKGPLQCSAYYSTYVIIFCLTKLGCCAWHGLVCASVEHMTRSSVKCKVVVNCNVDWCGLSHVTAGLSCDCCCVAVLGENFLKYMEAFKPFLAIGLKNHEEHQVCDYLCLLLRLGVFVIGVLHNIIFTLAKQNVIHLE